MRVFRLGVLPYRADRFDTSEPILKLATNSAINISWKRRILKINCMFPGIPQAWYHHWYLTRPATFDTQKVVFTPIPSSNHYKPFKMEPQDPKSWIGPPSNRLPWRGVSVVVFGGQWIKSAWHWMLSNLSRSRNRDVQKAFHASCSKRKDWAVRWCCEGSP